MSEASRRSVDRIFDPSYVDNLTTLPVEELRKKKAECEALEAEVSYARRLIQGKLDILRHGVERVAGGDKLEVTEMVEDLPGILSEGVGGSASRLPRIIAPANAPSLQPQMVHPIPVPSAVCEPSSNSGRQPPMLLRCECSHAAEPPPPPIRMPLNTSVCPPTSAPMPAPIAAPPAVANAQL